MPRIKPEFYFLIVDKISVAMSCLYVITDLYRSSYDYFVIKSKKYECNYQI